MVVSDILFYICRVEVLGPCSQLELLCSPSAASSLVHVLLWHAVDSLLILHIDS